MTRSMYWCLCQIKTETKLQAYGGITRVLKSPAIWLFVQKVMQADNKGTKTALYYLSFVLLIHLWPVDPPHNGSVMPPSTSVAANHHDCGLQCNPDSKVHGANMGPIWGWQDPGGPHVGPWTLLSWKLSQWDLPKADNKLNHIFFKEKFGIFVWVGWISSLSVQLVIRS